MKQFNNLAYLRLKAVEITLINIQLFDVILHQKAAEVNSLPEELSSFISAFEYFAVTDVRLKTLARAWLILLFKRANVLANTASSCKDPNAWKCAKLCFSTDLN